MQTNLGFLQGSLNMQVEEIAQKKQKKNKWVVISWILQNSHLQFMKPLAGRMLAG